MDAPKRRWPLWCLLFAIVAGVGTMVGLNLWNARYQLTKDKRETARQLWDKAGPKDYDITITVTGRTSAKYDLQVRNGQITFALQNDKPFHDDKGTLDKQRATHWTVPGLFDVLETELANAAKPEASPCHTQVEFDAQDGHPRSFLRSSSQGTTAIKVELKRLHGK
jgi:hypothetical protein